MTSPTTDLGALATRLEPRLRALYGDRANVALDSLLTVCRAHDRRANPPTRQWDERDAVLIAYADHVQRPGRSPLHALHDFLEVADLTNAFSLVHLLPFFPSSSDDGFSVMDYTEVDGRFGDWTDVMGLGTSLELGIDLVLNHLSRSSAWFQHYLDGIPPFDRFFVEADPRQDTTAVVRPRTSPLLTPVETTRGCRHVWTTFSDDQVDLDYAEPLVLTAIVDVMLSYIRRGARMIRLDAVGFVWKEVGTSCLHHPKTHLIVKVLRDVVDVVAPGTWLLTETNVPHHENTTYWGVGDEAHLIYNFALPPLLLDALLTGDGTALAAWMGDLGEPPPGTSLLNFTASHDGVGIRPLEALLAPARIQRLVLEIERRGGVVSYRADASGTPVPYELNVTYFDALADPEFPDSEHSIHRFLLSQVIAMSMRGVPAVYLPSLVAARNDISGVRATGRPRSINRHKFAWSELEDRCVQSATSRWIFDEYHRLLTVRRQQSAFHPDAPQEPVDLGSPALVAFTRSSRTSDQTILVIANVSGDEHRIDLRRLGHRFRRDLAHNRLRLGRRQRLTLGPYGFAWLPVRPTRPRIRSNQETPT